MAAPTKTVLKAKKRWFTVLAPSLFNNIELADVPAFATNDLIGRFVEANGQMLTGLPRDSNKKFILKISESKGDKVVTSPNKYYLTESFVQRSARKYKDRFILVISSETKDKVTVILKWQFYNQKRLHRSVRGEVLKRARNFSADTIKEIESSKIFDPNMIDKLSVELKKGLVNVFPIDKIFITRLELVQKRTASA